MFSLAPFFVSMEIIVVSVFCALVFGLFTAWLTYGKKTFLSMIIEFVVYIPLFLPPTVMGLYLLTIMGKNSFPGHLYVLLFSRDFIFSRVAAITAGSLAALPFIYKSVKSFLESINTNILTAAALDGADTVQIFFLIQLPLAQKGLLSGILLATLRAAGEFGMTMMVAGNIPGVTQTIPLAIWDSVMGGNLNIARQYSLILGVFSLGIILTAKLIDKNNDSLIL